MYRCCRHLENLEHQRLEQLSGMLRKYSELMLNLVTPLQEVSKDTTALLLYLNCVPYSFLSCFALSLSLS